MVKPRVIKTWQLIKQHLRKKRKKKLKKKTNKLRLLMVKKMRLSTTKLSKWRAALRSLLLIN